MEWELIASDEKDSLDSAVNHFISNYLVPTGYIVLDLETHYSTRNLQWETLITFEEESL